jgi:hypothetical protein
MFEFATDLRRGVLVGCSDPKIRCSGPSTGPGAGQAQARLGGLQSVITKQVKAALATHAVDDDGEAVRTQLADERRKRDNLVGAIEDGGENLPILLTA